MQSLLSALYPIFLSALLLVGCTRPEPPGSSPIEEAPTSAQLATPTQLVVQSRPTANPDCVDNASFLQDLTVPDGSQVAPGESVAKQWSVENSGSCDWGLGYRLIPHDPNPLVSGREAALYPARAGSSAIWSVTFDAPDEPGEYIGSWQAYNPQGQPFGDPVFVLLEVAAGQSEENQATTVAD